MKLTERILESSIIEYLNLRYNCFAFKVNTKASFHSKLGMFLKLPKHVLAGTPDIICIYNVSPTSSCPIFVGFEVKLRTNKQTPKQFEFEDRLNRKVGGFYFVVRSIEEVKECLEKVRLSVLQPISGLSIANSEAK